MRRSLMQVRALVATSMLLALGGCKDVLTVSNPGALQEGQLTEPALEQFMVNGAIGEFQYAYGNYALWSGVLADESYTDHTNVGVREFSLHNFNDQNSTNETIFENISRAIASADEATGRLKVILGASADRKSVV